MRGIQINALEEVYKRSALRKHVELSIEKNKNIRSSAAYSHVPVLRIRDIFGTDPDL
jgi:hypothetical protein